MAGLLTYDLRATRELGPQLKYLWQLFTKNTTPC